MDYIKELIADPTQLLIIVSAIVAGASLIAKGIQIITGITASKKDDPYADKLVKGIGWVQAVLDKLALNPPDKPKGGK